MRGTWLAGQKVIKAIGFDATEDHRTYATAGDKDLCSDPALPAYKDRYEMRYYLREWGMDREACGRTIVKAGLPLPPKSACFFCPAMKEAEIAELRVTDPVQYALAIEMERVYRAGRHFHGDDAWMVSAKHKRTGERVKVELFGRTAQDVRAQFRRSHNDTRAPHKWQLSVASAVVGLGRHWTWQDDGRLALPVL